MTARIHANAWVEIVLGMMLLLQITRRSAMLWTHLTSLYIPFDFACRRL